MPRDDSSNIGSWGNFYRQRKAAGKQDAVIMAEWKAKQKGYGGPRVGGNVITGPTKGPGFPSAKKPDNWLSSIGNSLGSMLGGLASSVGQVSKPDPLASILAQLGSASSAQAPSFNLQDYSGEASSMAKQQFAPQYQALDQAKAGAQGQYDKADPIIEGLYQKLVGDINSQAQQTGQMYDQAEAGRQAQGAAVGNQIQGAYGGAQNQTAEVLQRLGIQSAAPDVIGQMGAEQAWQQGQNANATSADTSFLDKSGLAAQEYQGNIANAENTKGAVARQDLLGQLSQALSGIEQQRLGVASQESSAATQLAQQLMSNQQSAFQSQQSAQQNQIQNLLQGYGLQQDAEALRYDRATQADQTQYDRSQDAMQNGLAAEEFNAKYGTPAGPDPKDAWDMTSDYRKGQIQMQQEYGEEGGRALNVAQQVAADLAGDNGSGAQTPPAELLNQIVAAAKANGINNQAAIFAAFQVVSPMLKLSTSAQY